MTGWFRVTFEPAPNATVADVEAAVRGWIDRHGEVDVADGDPSFERSYGALVWRVPCEFDHEVMFDVAAPFDRAHVTRENDAGRDTRWVFERRGAETVLVEQHEDRPRPDGLDADA